MLFAEIEMQKYGYSDKDRDIKPRLAVIFRSGINQSTIKITGGNHVRR